MRRMAPRCDESTSRLATLHEHDLALPDYSDVATQTIGGAIGTGTHGTGPRLHNLSRLLVGARVVWTGRTEDAFRRARERSAACKPDRPRGAAACAPHVAPASRGLRSP